MNTKSQIMCVWSGPVATGLFFMGIVSAGFFPPTPPTTSAAEIVAIYQQNATGIRVGMILLMMAGALIAPMVAAITVQMMRVENSKTPVLSLTQLVAGSAGVLLFIIPAMIWTTAVFRTDRLPETAQTLNDFAWIFTVMPFPPVFVQSLSIGFVILSDKREKPIFPRWVGFLNFWIALLIIPGCLLTFFKTGAFAWNGLLAFWVPAGIFGAWLLVMAIYVSKAAKQQFIDGNS